MIALTEERKQQIIEEEPGGLWLVLDEEYPRDVPGVADLLGATCPMPIIRQPGPSSLAGPGDAYVARLRD